MPAATAAAEPPDDPPATRVQSHGLRVTPKAECSVDEPMANSSRFALPTTTAPRARRRATAVASKGDTKSGRIREPHVVGRPMVTMLSLMATGTPAASRTSSATGMKASSSPRRAAMASRDAATPPSQISPSSLTADHPGHDEESVAPRWRVARGELAVDRRTRYIFAHRRRRGWREHYVADIDFGKLVDVAQDLRHLARHPIQPVIIEFQVGQIGNAPRFLTRDLHVRGLCHCPPAQRSAAPLSPFTRSEEHTSELQSPDHLVCRLLLEKKNIKRRNRPRL